MVFIYLLKCTSVLIMTQLGVRYNMTIVTIHFFEFIILNYISTPVTIKWFTL